MNRIYIFFNFLFLLIPQFTNSQSYQWENTFHNGPYNVPTAIKVDYAGNTFVAGHKSGFSVFKINTIGNQEWAQIFEGGAKSLVLDAAGNVYVTGFSNSDFATVKYNNAGALQWLKAYGDSPNGYDEASSIANTSSGSTFVTGFSYNDVSNFDYAVNFV